MSAQSRPVRVELRRVQLTDSATFTELEDDQAFVAMADPPPVRSIVAILSNAHPMRALEVTRVVEVAQSDDRGEVGLYGRLVDDREFDRPRRVGTEHLDDGVHASDESEAFEDADATVSGMAMPAPVVDPEPSGEIDVGETAPTGADAEDHGAPTEPPEPPSPTGQDDLETRKTRRRARRRG